MNIDISESIRKALLKLPLYHGIFAAFEGLEAVAFASRVENPQAFGRESLNIRLTVKAWCSSQGTWLVAIPIQFSNTPMGRGETCVFINPRQAIDYEVLQKLSTQQTFICMFVSADVGSYVNQEFPWPSNQRELAQQAIETIDQALTGVRIESNFDPDFDQAKREFESLHTVKKLLGE
jgi:hypothetical protein